MPCDVPRRSEDVKKKNWLKSGKKFGNDYGRLEFNKTIVALALVEYEVINTVGENAMQ